MRNAAKLTGRTLGDLRVVVSGAGASGIAVTKILLAAGIGDIAVADSQGHAARLAARGPERRSRPSSRRLTNKAGITGSSRTRSPGPTSSSACPPGKISEAAIASMAPNCLIFAMANPDPEVDPVLAAKYAAVVATGRSDFPNQINNVLAFPGVFKGAFEARARRISEGMKLAAADALAAVVGDDLSAECVIPSVFDDRVAPAVAAAVAQAARAEGLARA